MKKIRISLEKDSIGFELSKPRGFTAKMFTKIWKLIFSLREKAKRDSITRCLPKKFPSTKSHTSKEQSNKVFVLPPVLSSYDSFYRPRIPRRPILTRLSVGFEWGKWRYKIALDCLYCIKKLHAFKKSCPNSGLIPRSFLKLNFWFLSQS